MEYTSFSRRFAAYIIDGIILIIPSLLFGRGYGGFGASILIGLAYFPIFESSALCATPGKALMKMVVVSETGDRLTVKAAMVRFCCRYISIAISGIGYLMQPFTKKKQTLHDMLSEAVVIDRETPDLNYFSVWKDQFKVIINRL